jgi:acetyl esterase/lipase
VVLPGGGYQVKAAHEAVPIAQWLNSLGIAAFVLDYRVAPYRHPIPLLDARRAIQLVRCRAGELSIDPARIGILGFSAGGHLAASAGTHFEAYDSIYLPEDEVSAFSFRPDAMVLCYPVISFIQNFHLGSIDNLLGPDSSLELRSSLTNETRVTAQTPPAFIWHTSDDGSVPVENSLLFARALSACNIPSELHVFAHGIHGVGLAKNHPYAEPWTELCARWLGNLGFA